MTFTYSYINSNPVYRYLIDGEVYYTDGTEIFTEAQFKQEWS